MSRLVQAQWRCHRSFRQKKSNPALLACGLASAAAAASLLPPLLPPPLRPIRNASGPADLGLHASTSAPAAHGAHRLARRLRESGAAAGVAGGALARLEQEAGRQGRPADDCRRPQCRRREDGHRAARTRQAAGAGGREGQLLAAVGGCRPIRGLERAVERQPGQHRARHTQQGRPAHVQRHVQGHGADAAAGLCPVYRELGRGPVAEGARPSAGPYAPGEAEGPSPGGPRGRPAGWPDLIATQPRRWRAGWRG